MSFLTKAGRTQEVLSSMDDNDFGPIQGSDAYRYVPDTTWLTGERGTDMAAQDLYKGELSNLELDVAKMKLKGQGQVTEAERKIARDTLGGLTVADKATASSILSNTTKEAEAIVLDALRKGEVTVAQLENAGVNVKELLANARYIGTPDGIEPDVNSLIDKYGG
ncbi:MAG: hypothetical protein HRT64_14740 [Erythrobacter sp.]|nr:hypothetical protein [Erythrobacter sp.]